MEKKFDLLIDTKRTCFNAIRGLKEGDNNSVLNITLVQNSVPFDLTDLTVRINYKTPNNKLFLQMADVINPTEGEIKINVLTKVLNLAGEVKADLSVFDKDNRKITSVTFNMFVDASIYRNDYIEPEDLDLIQSVYTEEEKRIRQEKAREKNEDIRKEKEIARETEENKRVKTEKIRQENENKRVESENIRADTESIRKSNETNRDEAEKIRQVNEKTRLENEKSREKNETKRIESENKRETQEVARQQGYTNMKNNIDNFSVCEEYNPKKEYKKFNRVTFGGSSYECLKDCAGIEPSNAGYWICIAEKGKDGDGAGDMLKEVYDKNNNGIVDLAEKANSVEWENVKNKPDLNGKVTSINGKTGEVELKATDIKFSEGYTLQHFNYITNRRLDNIFCLDRRHYYIDSVNGNDNNDGTSKETAFKTLSRASSEMPMLSYLGGEIDIINDLPIKNNVFFSNCLSGSNNLKIFSSNGSKLIGDGGTRYIYIDNTPWMEIQDLTLDNIAISPRHNTYIELKRINFLNSNSPVYLDYGATAYVTGCKFGVHTDVCLTADTLSRIHSYENSGEGKTYGLRALRGSLISKDKGQPTGADSNEFTASGGVIR
ncbi:phage baseplate upper protein [Clostridium tetani]|uniref:DUF2479 domain-containing protein n=1 Tax=Clostridium tetani TaxID=1513 RepID=A0ABY0ETU5_CLOTA|nr:phage baseplate upper protein [Clostridium tetani]RXI57406.1 DUF2479 domain-containing protein [Clostridium tetani]RXI66984.1 DUF2479 domain-containing protein [Clostridium tetani]